MYDYEAKKEREKEKEGGSCIHTQSYQNGATREKERERGGRSRYKKKLLRDHDIFIINHHHTPKREEVYIHGKVCDPAMEGKRSGGGVGCQIIITGYLISRHMKSVLPRFVFFLFCFLYFD